MFRLKEKYQLTIYGVVYEFRRQLSFGLLIIGFLLAFGLRPKEKMEGRKWLSVIGRIRWTSTPQWYFHRVYFPSKQSSSVTKNGPTKQHRHFRGCAPSCQICNQSQRLQAATAQLECSAEGHGL
jgi:hypothetical protein